jgi:hypothetical protein
MNDVRLGEYAVIYENVIWEGAYTVGPFVIVG